MQSSRIRANFKYGWAVLALLLAQSASASAQDTVLAAALKTGSVEAATSPALAPKPFVTAAQEAPQRHNFWDNKNRALFATVAGFGAADFFVTRANLGNGGRELNPVTRIFSGSTPGLVVNFSLETGGIIGASYLFHKTGHHKLERIVSVVNIGGSAAALGYGLSHR
jgi:hypothetical protein